MKRKGICLALALTGIGIIILLVEWDVVWHANLERGAQLFPTRHGNEWHDGPVKPYVPPTAEELREYMSISDAIVTAYSNGQEKSMLECAKRFPAAAYGLRGEDHRKVILPINLLWFSEWIKDKEVRDFMSANEFERSVSMKLSIARIYGNFIVNSGLTANSVLLMIDVSALERLQKYKDKFSKEGNLDFLKAAERLHSDWIQQIESEKGFTRAYVRAQERGLMRLVRSGELTPEKLRLNVRARVYSLQKSCGYTPKWLDEEFPAVPVARVNSK